MDKESSSVFSHTSVCESIEARSQTGLFLSTTGMLRHDRLYPTNTSSIALSRNSHTIVLANGGVGVIGPGNFGPVEMLVFDQNLT